MIISESLGNISPIVLSVVLITYLMIIELGSKRIKKALFPFVIVLGIIFLVIAVTSIYSTYMGIK